MGKHSGEEERHRERNSILIYLQQRTAPLPFGTLLKVRNPSTGDTVFVIVNDRGPFAKHRIIDLSDSAAKRIGIYRNGVGKVLIEVMRYGPAPFVPAPEIQPKIQAAEITHIAPQKPGLEIREITSYSFDNNKPIVTGCPTGSNDQAPKKPRFFLFRLFSSNHKRPVEKH